MYSEILSRGLYAFCKGITYMTVAFPSALQNIMLGIGCLGNCVHN